LSLVRAAAIRAPDFRGFRRALGPAPRIPTFRRAIMAGQIV